MSPDSRGGRWRLVDPPEALADPPRIPVDVELERLDAGLRAAGARARLAGRATTQPTRYFAQQLRIELIARLDDRNGSIT